jgi:hypothetical protein
MNNDNTLYNYPTAGWPEWNNRVHNVTGEHVFIMPGFYDITLVPIPSTNNPNYTTNCSGLKKKMHVYVEEIVPQTDFTTSVLSGASPIEITFNPLSTIAGSFSICRLDWNFGDNTPTTTISRLMSAEYTNYYNTSTFSDLSDPRNIVVTHVFNRTNSTQLENYVVSLSAFACNTNTVNIKNTTIGPISQITLDNIEGDIHLLENRMYSQDDNLLLVFEGQKSKNSFTVLLSAETL